MSKIDLINKNRIEAMREKNELAKNLYSTLKGEYENAIKNGQPADDTTVEKFAKKLTESAKTIGTPDALTEIELLKQFMPVMLGENEIKNIIQTSIVLNPDKANNYRLGNKGAFTGIVMKQLSGKADANVVNKMLSEILV